MCINLCADIITELFGRMRECFSMLLIWEDERISAELKVLIIKLMDFNGTSIT